MKYTAFVFSSSINLRKNCPSSFCSRHRPLHAAKNQTRPEQNAGALIRKKWVAVQMDAGVGGIEENEENKLRDRAWRDAIRAVIDEHVDSGRNVCIGDGNASLLMPLLDAIDVHVHASSKLDMAFVATTPHNSKLLAERKLTSDLSVNYKKSIDVYIAPAASVDSQLNVVLDSTCPASDANAANYAKQCVFISPRVHILEPEDDDAKDVTKELITKFPIQIDPFLPECTTKSMQEDETLGALGISAIKLRPQSSADSSCVVADVELTTQGTHDLATQNISVLIDELKRHPAVLGVGLFAAGKNSTVVFAASGSDPVDITPVQATLSTRAKELSKAAVGDARRDQAISEMKPWRVLRGPVSSIGGTFSFQRVAFADAFVRSVHHLARASNHHPEIRQNYTQVKICLSTYDAGGVTELDLLFAKELTRVYRVMSK